MEVAVTKAVEPVSNELRRKGILANMIVMAKRRPGMLCFACHFCARVYIASSFMLF